MQTRDEIKQMNRALQCACQNNETNVALLNGVLNILTQANWNTIVGNSIDYTYDANDNVTLAEYYTGATLVFTQAFTYDANNNCTNITTT